ncbi:MAG: hypothetical protein KJO49_07770 [Bacteroidia bacterium]|nr:hypothetical protein [Bacteroidia bacterium]NNF81306.1 hypothetical protein [Flavobacteriaceae bacterium]NNL79893.1 hypothetical protein [Flavobacteriaceae bacterium]
MIPKLTTILLVVALLTPELVKLAHAVQDHHHDHCTSLVNEHIHEQEWDCEFQDYQLSPQLSFHFQTDIVLVQYIEPESFSYFNDIIVCQTDLTEKQRGPPSGLRTVI